MSFKKEVREALTEIKVEIAKNTTVLLEHHVRSSNLEARFKPVEKHVLVINSIAKILAGVIATLAAAGSIYHYLSK